MSSIEQYQKDVQRYQILKNKIESVAHELDLAVEHAGSVDLEIRGKYKINDGSTNLAGRAASIRDKIAETAAYLRNKVVPSIDSSVSYTNSQIAYLEEQERLERERQAAEEAARRQEEEELRRQEEAGQNLEGEIE